MRYLGVSSAVARLGGKQSRRQHAPQPAQPVYHAGIHHVVDLGDTRHHPSPRTDNGQDGRVHRYIAARQTKAAIYFCVYADPSVQDPSGWLSEPHVNRKAVLPNGSIIVLVQQEGSQKQNRARKKHNAPCRNTFSPNPSCNASFGAHVDWFAQ